MAANLGEDTVPHPEGVMEAMVVTVAAAAAMVEGHQLVDMDHLPAVRH
jgi:hypothetical protein